MEHAEGVVWFCLSTSSLQDVVLPVSLVCSCWSHRVGLGMLLLLTQTVLEGVCYSI